MPRNVSGARLEDKYTKPCLHCTMNVVSSRSTVVRELSSPHLLHLLLSCLNPFYRYRNPPDRHGQSSLPRPLAIVAPSSVVNVDPPINKPRLAPEFPPPAATRWASPAPRVLCCSFMPPSRTSPSFSDLLQR